MFTARHIIRSFIRHLVSQDVRNLDAPKFQEVLQYNKPAIKSFDIFFLQPEGAYLSAVSNAHDPYNCKRHICSLRTKPEVLSVELNRNSKRHAKP